VNGDGRPDVVLGAPGVFGDGGDNAGAAYVAYGFGAAAVAYPSVAGRVGVSIEPVAPTVARTGAAAFAIEPALPAGLTLDPLTGTIAGTPTTAVATTFRVTLSDLSGDAAAALPIAIAGTPTTTPPPAAPPPPACTSCEGGPAGGGAAAPSAPRLRATIGFAAAALKGQTRFTALYVRPAWAGTTVRVGCTGRGCLFRSYTRRVRKDAAKLDLTAVVRRSRLRPAARVEVRVTKQHTMGVVRRLTVRAGRRPAATDLCLAPGSTRPARCPA